MHRAHLLESCHVRRELYWFGLGVPTDVLWFALPKSAPPTALDPRLHRQRDIVLTIERGEHYRAGLNVKTNNSLHRPGAGTAPFRPSMAYAIGGPEPASIKAI